MKLSTKLAVLMMCTAIAAGAQEAKYIFYYIGDGMGMGPSVAAETYNRLVKGNDMPIPMFTMPVAGMCLTYSASSPVTDSAAAGTALSTGSKTKNGMLGMNADTVAVTSIARYLKDDGYGVGIITTVAPDDATPGAFYAHVPNRKYFYEIGVQAAESGYDFLAGAGLRGVTDSKGNPTDLVEVMERNNVQLVYGREQMQSATADKIFLLNYAGTDNNNVGYTIDSIERTITLPYITEQCLKHLENKTPDKFFMMVEGGNIDHALHANDGGATIKEVLNFNEALDIALDFYRKHPDETLIVVTADHDTAGMSIGNEYTGYNAFLGNIDYQRVSKEAFQRYCYTILDSDKPYSWDDMRRYLHDNFGFWGPIPLTDAQTQALKQKFDETFELRNGAEQQTLYSIFNSFATSVFKLFNDIAGIGFIDYNHTGNPVPVFAIGVGADRFASLNNNIEIPTIILDIVRNPK